MTIFLRAICRFNAISIKNLIPHRKNKKTYPKQYMEPQKTPGSPSNPEQKGLTYNIKLLLSLTDLYYWITNIKYICVFITCFLIDLSVFCHRDPDNSGIKKVEASENS